MWPCKIGRSLDDKLGIFHCRVWLLQGNYARNPQNFAMCHNSIPSGPSRNGKPQLFPTTQGYPTQRFNFQEQRGTIRWRNAHFDYPKTKRGSPVKCSISHSARLGLKQDIHTMFVHLYRTWPPPIKSKFSRKGTKRLLAAGFNPQWGSHWGSSPQMLFTRVLTMKYPLVICCSLLLKP